MPEYPFIVLHKFSGRVTPEEALRFHLIVKIKSGVTTFSPEGWTAEEVLKLRTLRFLVVRRSSFPPRWKKDSETISAKIASG